MVSDFHKIEQYIWGEQKQFARLPAFKKYCSMSDGDRFHTLCNEFNKNDKSIGHEVALCKRMVPLEISLNDDRFM